MNTINIEISSNLVDIAHYCIEQFTCYDFKEIDESSFCGLAANAIIHNNLMSLTEHLKSIRTMLSVSNYSIEHGLADLFTDAPLTKLLITQILDMSPTPARSDVINILSNIQNAIFSHYPVSVTKKEVHDLLLSIVKFYLLDEPINFNYLIKNNQLVSEFTQSSWLFEDINPYIKNLLLSKVSNNNIALDIDIFYSLSASYPLFLKEVDKSLNFMNMESGFGVFSNGFSKDLNRIKSIQASSSARIKAEKYKQDTEQAFKNIEELWNTGNWRNATKCAQDIFDIEGVDLPYTTVYNHIRSYIRSKKLDIY